jgi:hypothetical protein
MRENEAWGRAVQNSDIIIILMNRLMKSTQALLSFFHNTF